MAELPAVARAAIESGALAHLVTINIDGSPQVACVWVGIDGDELVTAHLAPDQRKLKARRARPRVALSLELPARNAIALQHYAVVHGRGAADGRRRAGAPASSRAGLRRARHAPSRR